MNGYGKKLAKIILAALGFTGVLIAFMLMFLHGPSQRTQAIRYYLDRRYQVGIDDSVDVSFNGDKFILMTKDNVKVWGTCGFFGNPKTESYVNYYYADGCTEHIRKKIGDCFSDCLIIYDGIKLSELGSMPFEAGSINSYDEYVTATKNTWENAETHKYYYKISIRVYIRESEYTGNVNEAMARLLDSKEYFDVFFFAVPDELFDIHKEKDIRAYVAGRSFDELEDNLDKETCIELEDLIYREEGLTDEYCMWDRNSSVFVKSKGPMLVISSTIEGPIDYYNDDRLLGVTYTIDWNGTITMSSKYLTSGEVIDGCVTLSDTDFRKFYNFGEKSYKKDPFKGYSENVDDGSTYGFTYYPAGTSEGVLLYGGYCYSNQKLWGMVELARSYFK